MRNLCRLLSIFLIVAAGPKALTKEPVVAGPAGEQVRAVALPVAKELMQTLEDHLKEAMQEGGPVAAIEVCQEQALALTEKVRSEKEIVYLKRVGKRIRNPQNAPDSHEQRALEYFAMVQKESGTIPDDWVDTVEVAGGQVRYYKAIVLQARCLPCHGPDYMIPEVVKAAIDTRYPDDAARGFNLGELRGLLVVGLDAEAVE